MQTIHIDAFAYNLHVILELLEVCLRATFFKVDNKIFHQKDGMAMGSCLSPNISNIYLEHFEKLALDSAQHHCGSIMLMLHLWSSLMAQESYRISSATLIAQGLLSNLPSQ
jgi:hypothetical protein